MKIPEFQNSSTALQKEYAEAVDKAGVDFLDNSGPRASTGVFICRFNFLIQRVGVKFHDELSSYPLSQFLSPCSEVVFTKTAAEFRKYLKFSKTNTPPSDSCVNIFMKFLNDRFWLLIISMKITICCNPENSPNSV